MSDRDDHNPGVPDQAHAVKPAEEAQASTETDDAPALEADQSHGADQPGATGAAGSAAQPPAEIGGGAGADATPLEGLEAMAGSVAGEAADSIDQAEDDVGRLIAEVEALTGSDDPPPAEAPAGDEAPSAGAPGDSPRAEKVDGPAESASAPMNDDSRPGTQQGESAGRTEPAGADPADNEAPGAPEAPEAPGAPEAPEALPDPGAAVADQLVDRVAGDAAPEARAPGDNAGRDPGAGGGSGDPALTEIDEILAKDVEELLEGSFEVVSGVLDDVFDEHAIAVTEDKDGAAEASGENEIPPPAEVGGAEQPPPAKPDKRDEDQFDALTGAASFESVEEVVGAEKPVAAESTAQAAMETEARTGTAPSPAVDSPAESTADAVDDRVAALDAEPAEPAVPAVSNAGPEAAVDATIEAADAKEKEAEPVGDEPPAHVSELLPPRSPADAQSAAAAVGSADAPPPVAMDANAEDEPIEAAEAGGLQLLLSSIAPMVLPVLQAISYPLRFVPPSLRPVVDWVALSMIFWVPIVWIVALFLIGR